MTPLDMMAALTFATGLFAAGYLVGRAARPTSAPQSTPLASAPTLDVEITLMRKTIRTDIAVDTAQLERLANGCGMYLAPLASRSLQ